MSGRNNRQRSEKKDSGCVCIGLSKQTENIPQHSEQYANKPIFHTAIANNKTALRVSNNTDVTTGLSTMLSKMKQSEILWAADRGKFQLQMKNEKLKNSKLEAEVRRSTERCAFFSDKANHLTAALKRRDDDIEILKDQIRELQHALKTNEDSIALSQLQKEQEEYKSSIREEVYEMAERVITLSTLAEMAGTDAEASEHQYQQIKKTLELAEMEREQWIGKAAALEQQLLKAKQVLVAMREAITETKAHQHKRVVQLRKLLLMTNYSDTIVDDDDHDDDDKNRVIDGLEGISMENSEGEIEAVLKKNSDEKCEEADGGNGRLSDGDSEEKGVF
jgi:chromosome segregation ATPase